MLDKFAKVFDMKQLTLLLFAESLENDSANMDKKQKVANDGDMPAKSFIH